MFKIADRVKETSTTAGSGTITLLGALGGFQSFAHGIGEGNSTYYAIENGANWEVGYGTYSSNTLSRDLVLQSSNGDSHAILAGVSVVFCTYPADKSAIFDDTNFLSLIDHSGIKFPDGSLQTTAIFNPTYTVQYVSGVNAVASGNVVLVNAGISDITITLPDSPEDGTIRIIKKVDAGSGNVIISRQSSNTIDGNINTRLYYSYENMSFVSDGSNWHIV